MGDKETFHLAWILAGAPWAMPDYPARPTATGIYHRGFDGQLLFQHRSSDKWRLRGPIQPAEEFRFQEECVRFIAELRERWSGTISALSPRSERDVQTEDELAALRWFSLEQPGVAGRLLELLAGNRVGVGSKREHLLRWYVREGVLRIDGVARALPPLTRQAGGHWASADSSDQLAVSLVPAPDAGRDAIGSVAAAVLERFLEGDGVTEDEAVNTLATLARIGDLTAAFQRARGRWPHDSRALRVIDRAGDRAGVSNPSEVPRGRPGYEPIT
jgi:hypothetical protein